MEDGGERMWWCDVVDVVIYRAKGEGRLWRVLVECVLHYGVC